ncbi:MAG TPA: transketolase [Nitrospirota bacterium]|nr:transketolase [Nitrospirota bacterium]
MNDLESIAKFMRYYSLVMSSEAGSGHPTSSLSAADLMTGLVFGGTFKYDLDNPQHPNNDRLIFSKGHASPLFYSMWAAAGRISEKDMLAFRKFTSPLEGHPTREFKYTEAATGSLGQGLSIGVGMALNAKYLDKLSYRTYVLLGDSEMAEGSQWEAMEIAAHYRLGNLTGIIDVNRLGQRGETMYGHDLSVYRDRVASFGWEPIVIDGHYMPQILTAFKQAQQARDKPVMIIAKTLKGKGVSFIEDKNGWHGKPLKKDELARALRELGPIDKTAIGQILKPEDVRPAESLESVAEPVSYSPDKPVATRHAYGTALERMYPKFPTMVVLDAEVSNSTYSEIFKAKYPERFFEMFIAEQNMIGNALGLSIRGKVPFVSTFAAFLTRAFDQIRMSQYSLANIKICGSHAGVSIGEDGSSQMGLEDIAMFRTLLNSVVLYPSDAVSTEKLVEEMAKHNGIDYIRTTRRDTPILYRNDEVFRIGGSKVLRSNKADVATVVAAGITLHEALRAYEELKQEGVFIQVIDLYSIKPIDGETLLHAARRTGLVITVEDHVAEGGLGEAVTNEVSLAGVPVYTLAVRKMPRSGTSDELLAYEGISHAAIVNAVKDRAKKHKRKT